MQIIEKAISDLRPYEQNPRKNAEAVKYVANSIKEFGFKVPVVIDKNNVIVAGHTRLLAAKKLKMKTVPCLIADDLTDEQVKAFRLADNKTAEFAAWDNDLLALELVDLSLDMTQFGFGNLELPKEIVEDEAPAVEETTTQKGDIFLLGEHRLMCGDSTRPSDINILLGGEHPDMILSDPPYGMSLNTDFSGCVGILGNIGRKHNTQGNKYDAVIGDNEDFSPELIDTFFKNLSCKEMFLFGADYYAELLPEKNKGSWLVWDKRKESQADAIGSEFELIWSRNKHKRRVLRFDWFGFLASNDKQDAQHRVHPTQKPVSLLAEILRQWGEKAKTVVDLYGGSGSTLLACEQTGKRCLMMEIDPHYCDVIVKRWEQYTGCKAKKG